MKVILFQFIFFLFSYAQSQDLKTTFIDSLNNKFDTIVQQIFLVDISDLQKVVIYNQNIEVNVKDDNAILLNKFISSLPKNSIKSIITRSSTLNISSLKNQRSSLECLNTLYINVDTLIKLNNLKSFFSFSTLNSNDFKLLRGCKSLEYLWIFADEKNTNYIRMLPKNIIGLSVNMDTIGRFKFKKLREFYIFPSTNKEVIFTKESRLKMPSLEVLDVLTSLNEIDIDIICKLMNIQYLGINSIKSDAIYMLQLLEHIENIWIRQTESFKDEEEIKKYRNVHIYGNLKNGIK